MSVTLNIARSYRRPRETVAAMIRQGITEAQVLAYLLLACALVFVAQWPGLSRAATLDPDIAFDQRMGGVLFAVMFLLPLVLYAVAGILQLLLRLLSGPVPGLWVRLALFWGFLAVAPLMLVQGGLTGFLGATVAVGAFGFVVWGVFLYIVGTGLVGVVQLARQHRT